MSLIVPKSLTKTDATDSVEVKVLQDASFEIEAGAFLAFIGPSGSGKTTLLNLVGCLDKPTSGELRVAGIDVLGLGRRQAAEFRGQNIGFIFQSFNLIAVLTAFENVEYPLVMVQELPLAERRDRVLKALQAVAMLGSGSVSKSSVGATPCGRPSQRADTGVCPYIGDWLKSK